MLRLHFLQHWYNLSGAVLEEELLESESMRRFVGIDLGVERVPDEPTVCKFRYLLERHGLGEQIFKRVNEHLQDSGFRLSAGTIVDAVLVSAPTSTKNRDRARDPEMGTTKKGGQWLHGMKAHIGVDEEAKLIHTVKATPGNAADTTMLCHLLHRRERSVWGDRVCFGLGRMIKGVTPKTPDPTQLKNNVHRRLTPLDEMVNDIHSRTRAKVEPAPLV